MVPTRWSWMLQESPSALIVLAAAAALPQSSITAMPLTARITAAAFVSHYIHRAFLYPLATRPSTATPLLVMALALCFCIWNGTMQVPFPSLYARLEHIAFDCA